MDDHEEDDVDRMLRLAFEKKDAIRKQGNLQVRALDAWRTSMACLDRIRRLGERQLRARNIDERRPINKELEKASDASEIAEENYLALICAMTDEEFREHQNDTNRRYKAMNEAGVTKI